jgi:hypothetical protein
MSQIGALINIELNVGGAATIVLVFERQNPHLRKIFQHGILN